MSFDEMSPTAQFDGLVEALSRGDQASSDDFDVAFDVTYRSGLLRVDAKVSAKAGDAVITSWGTAVGPKGIGPFAHGFGECRSPSVRCGSGLVLALQPGPTDLSVTIAAWVAMPGQAARLTVIPFKRTIEVT